MIAIIGIVIFAATVSGEKDELRKLLQERKATDIKISYLWMDFDKSNHSFEVEYIDHAGVHHSTLCKMGIWTGGPYWAEEPPRAPGTADPAATDLEQREQALLSELAEIRRKREENANRSGEHHE